MDTVAIASITASAIVGVAGVWVPASTRRGDRRHGLELRLRDKRAEAYETILRLMVRTRNFDEVAAHEISEEASTLVWLWGSPKVRDLFFRWLEILPTAFGPDATKGTRDTVLAAANAVREQIGAEVQGTVPIG